MDVELYVYDLSRGLARAISRQLLGTQIDAVYHTSIVLDGAEYVYDRGIHMEQPGFSHLGRPEQIVKLGRTELPKNIIMDYLESMSLVYTAEAYDLWTNNCNNFTNDFSTFLLGKGIPKTIANLPQTVQQSPFGQMLKPIIDESLRRARPGGVVGLSGTAIGAGHAKVPQTTHQQAASVKNPNSMHDFNELLAQARETCAVIFFTSQTCGPCKILYPVFDQLAAEAGAKCRFIKVDIGSLPEIGRLYSVRATPTFITYLKGEQENNWSGADPTALRGNVKLLLEMAWPRHAHESMQLTTLRSSTKPVLYGKVPPIEKLLSKMGPVASSPAVLGVKDFVAARSADGSAEAALPDLDAFSWFLRDAVRQLPPETLFPVVDLLRAAMVDSRFSGYYAEEKDHKTIAPLITYVSELTNCPYALRLVALQMCCNLFSSPLYVKHILGCPSLTAPIVRLLIDSLLDDKHNNVRVVAASLAFNISLEASKIRTDDHREELSEAEQVELAASILEAISVEEESAEALRGFLLALGYLVYCMSHDSELAGLLKSMDAQSTILGKLKKFPKEPLISEVGKDLLAAKL